LAVRGVVGEEGESARGGMWRRSEVDGDDGIGGGRDVRNTC